MKTSARNKTLLLAIAAIALGVVALQFDFVQNLLFPIPQPTLAGEYLVRTNTVLTHDSLKVGVGNCKQQSYTDESGQMTSGLTCALFFYVRDHPETDKTVRVHLGQIVEIDQYVVTVAGTRIIRGVDMIGLDIAP